MTEELFRRRLEAHEFYPARPVRYLRAGRNIIAIDAETREIAPDPRRYIGDLVVSVDFYTGVAVANLVTPRYSREVGDWDEYRTVDLSRAIELGWDGIIPVADIAAWQADQEAKTAATIARDAWIATLPAELGEYRLARGEVHDQYGNYICELPGPCTMSELIALIDERAGDYCED